MKKAASTLCAPKHFIEFAKSHVPNEDLCNLEMRDYDAIYTWLQCNKAVGFIEFVKGYVLGKNNSLITEPDYTCPQIDKAVEVAHKMADTVLMEEEIDKMALMLKRSVREQYATHISELEKELNKVRHENALMREFWEQFKWEKGNHNE